MASLFDIVTARAQAGNNNASANPITDLSGNVNVGVPVDLSASTPTDAHAYAVDEDSVAIVRSMILGLTALDFMVETVAVRDAETDLSAFTAAMSQLKNSISEEKLSRDALLQKREDLAVGIAFAVGFVRHYSDSADFKAKFKSLDGICNTQAVYYSRGEMFGKQLKDQFPCPS